MNVELHSLILWEKARKDTDKIVKDLQTKFEICEIYEIYWTNTIFAKNLKRFYGVTLADPEEKKRKCGSGPFLLILILDNNPKHGKRKTSLGSQTVNTNVYDLKMQYRRMLGTGYIIHSSIHQKEANHDFTLLLGKNVKELINNFDKPWDGKIKNMDIELLGNVWKDPKDIFYLLNSTVNYVVLRNFEKFPDELITSEHTDVDILTDEKFQIPYLLNMQKVNSENIGFSPFLEIGGKKIKFDLRYIDDGYYDENWAKDILNRREMSKAGFFVPSKEDYFFSLLYHVVVHKKKLGKDYSERLYNMKPKSIQKEFSKEQFSDFGTLKKILDSYMKQNRYKNTDSSLYILKHNEISRLGKVGIHTIKYEGWNFLFRAIKFKLKKSFSR